MSYIKLLTIYCVLIISFSVSSAVGSSEDDESRGCGYCLRRAIERVSGLVQWVRGYGKCAARAPADRLPHVTFVRSLPQALTIHRPIMVVHTDAEGLEAIKQSRVFTSVVLAQLQEKEVAALRGASSDRLYQGAQNLEGLLKLGASISIDEIVDVYKRAADKGNKDAIEVVGMMGCLPLWETHPITGMPVRQGSLRSLTITERQALQNGYRLLKTNAAAGHASSRETFLKMDWERIKQEADISL